MKQIYHHYEKWEDFNNGMYTLEDVLDKDIKVLECISLFKDPNEFYNTLKKVVSLWGHSTEVNLTNKSQNRRAWLGAAACLYKCSAPEYITRISWNLLNKDVQQKANLVAEKVINEYESENIGIHKRLGKQVLF